MTTTITAVYAVVPWSNSTPGLEFAVVDLERYTAHGDDEAVLTYGSNSIELAFMADKLNARLEKASEGKQLPAGALVLDEDTNRMLERVTAGLESQVSDTLMEHPLISILRKAVEESGDAQALAALDESEAEFKANKVVVTKEDVISQFIKKLYLDGVACGEVKP